MTENKIQFKKSHSAEKQSPEAECNMEERKCSQGELSQRLCSHRNSACITFREGVAGEHAQMDGGSQSLNDLIKDQQMPSKGRFELESSKATRSTR